MLSLPKKQTKQSNPNKQARQTFTPNNSKKHFRDSRAATRVKNKGKLRTSG
jgi:hypothetical protein